jgi:hypothetical protein
MDWRNFFKLNVMKSDSSGHHPYFRSMLRVSDKLPMEELLINNFEKMGDN